MLGHGGPGFYKKEDPNSVGGPQKMYGISPVWKDLWMYIYVHVSVKIFKDMWL